MILLLGVKGDPTIQAVATHLAREPDIIVLWLDLYDLVDGITIEDEITAGSGPSVRWSDGTQCWNSGDVSGVLSRLDFRAEFGAFEAFAPDESEYVYCEYAAYLLFALRSLDNVLNPPSNRIDLGRCRSLPYQWSLVRQLMPRLRVPCAFLGNPRDDARILNFRHNAVIARDVYDGRYWETKPWDPADPQQEESSLVYERPRGRPIVIVVVGQSCWVNHLDNGTKCGIDDMIVSMLCPVLMAHFGLVMAEILIFFDEENQTYTFGSISEDVQIESVSKASREEFVELVCAMLHRRQPTRNARALP